MSLASWMGQTINVASLTGVDATGKIVFGSPRPLKARVEQSRRLVRKTNGDEVQSTHRVYCLSEILLTDRVWLPGLSTSTPEGSKTPLQVTSANDKTFSRALYQVDL
jgi:hypothetical protein